MKKLLAVIALIVVLTAGAIGADSIHYPMRQEMPVVDYVPNQVDLYLPANPTTGYSWICDVEDPALVEIRDQYFEYSQEPGFVGGGGEHWFHISGVRPGTTSVTFRYLRSWEPDTPAEQTTYRLTVNDQLDVLIWGVEVA